MIVEKDNLQYYGDKNGNPDVLLYAPNNYLNILKYIKINKIKKNCIMWWRSSIARIFVYNKRI